MIKNPDYIEALREATLQLEEMESQLFTSIINIGMCGVYHEIHSCMEVGEVFEFEPLMFSGTEDRHLEKLLALLLHLQKTRQQLNLGTNGNAA